MKGISTIEEIEISRIGAKGIMKDLEIGKSINISGFRDMKQLLRRAGYVISFLSEDKDKSYNVNLNTTELEYSIRRMR